MNRFIKILLGLLPVMGTLSLHSQCYELVWAEEFDSARLPDPVIWNMETGGHGWGNNELQYYRADSSNAYIDDSILVITARKEAYGGNSYTSARMTTQEKYTFQYGKIEARMQLPYGQGIWPAFWMLGQDINEASWPGCGEIDIMEMVGGEGRDNTVHGTLHWDHNGQHASHGEGYTLADGIFADNFHVFTMEWTPKVIKWYIDGNYSHAIDIQPSGLSEFHQPFFIILNLAVGGNWPGNPDASTVFPQELKVDYIRVYKDAMSLEIAGDPVAGPLSPGNTFSLPYSENFTYQWTVPEDALITAGQGTESIEVRWGCSEGEVSCLLGSSCGDTEYDFSVEAETAIQGPVFADEGEEGLLFYISEIEGSSFQWTVPEGAVITTGQGSDSIYVTWGNEPGEVQVSCENACGQLAYSHEVLISGRYPFPDPHVAHAIPGIIMATDYDYGGEGVAYHDLTSYNEGDGDRQDENVDTQFSDNGNANVGWIQTGEWMDYSIRVDSSWWYKLAFRVASPNTTGEFSILANGEHRLGPVQVNTTGAWDRFITLRGGPLQLFESDTVLRILVDNGGFNLGKMQFSLANTTSVEGHAEAPNLRLYPNPVTDRLYLEYGHAGFSYVIYNMKGQQVGRGESTESSTELELSGLSQGMYRIKLTDASGKTAGASFLKH